MSDKVQDVIDGVRAWATGYPAMKAGVELLIRAGRIHPDYPWVENEYNLRWVIDTDKLLDECGVLSSGEQRVVQVAVSLIDERHKINLADEITGLDSRNARLVLTALTAATGAPFNEPTFDAATGAITGYVETMPALYRWEDAGA